MTSILNSYSIAVPQLLLVRLLFVSNTGHGKDTPLWDTIVTQTARQTDGATLVSTKMVAFEIFEWRTNDLGSDGTLLKVNFLFLISW